MRKIKAALIFALAMFFLTGCSKSDSKEDSQKMYLYLINNAETKIVNEEYKLEYKQHKDMVNDIIKSLQKDPKDLSNKKAIPDNVNLPTVELIGEDKVRLSFGTTYNKLTGIQELLRRAAIVKTLCQLEFVSNVEFYVEDTPLTDSDGKQVGPMTEASFIESFNYIEKQKIILYYANEQMKLLKGVVATADYDGSSTLERIIIDQLIKGTSGIKNFDKYYKTVKPTLPSGTVCNTINTVDYTCYVDLNKKFLKGADGISNELVLYSIVNSLTNLSTINKVKFTIDGKSESTFGTVKNFDQFFEMNYNLIEKDSENTTNKTKSE